LLAAGLVLLAEVGVAAVVVVVIEVQLLANHQVVEHQPKAQYL